MTETTPSPLLPAELIASQILFTKMFGDTVVIVTDKTVVFIRTVNGVLAADTVYPQLHLFGAK